MPDALRDLLDRQALAELVHAYCRAVDRREFAALFALYHPDAWHDHGAMFAGGPAALRDWLAASMPPDMTTHHFVGNTLFHVRGDEAEGEIYTLNSHIIPAPTGTIEYLAGGRYLDQYRRVDGRWRFWRRTRVVDWSRQQPAAPAASARGVAQGVAGPADPSHALLPGLAAREW